jgi:threonine/homoserine/homoserine lactone efflux protein
VELSAAKVPAHAVAARAGLLALLVLLGAAVLLWIGRRAHRELPGLERLRDELEEDSRG